MIKYFSKYFHSRIFKLTIAYVIFSLVIFSLGMLFGEMGVVSSVIGWFCGTILWILAAFSD